jgi:hypothetical protein
VRRWSVQITRGAVVGSQAVELPDGGLLQVGMMLMPTAGGRYLEKVGVEPDIVVPIDWAAIREGRDLTLDTALAALSRMAGTWATGCLPNHVSQSAHFRSRASEVSVVDFESRRLRSLSISSWCFCSSGELWVLVHLRTSRCARTPGRLGSNQASVIAHFFLRDHSPNRR